jgi:CheY-like chemotaxis protein
MVRVLYVDDDRINSLLFVETCRVAGGAEVETAATAGEALELVQSWAPDLLVIDLHLPDGNGYELLPALRGCLSTPPPAYLCTADEAPLVEQPARAAGFDGCWAKPVPLQELKAALARCRPASA